MASYNKVTIMGNLGQDPELRRTQNDKAVCNFSVATTEKFNDKEETTWHSCVTWNATAENCAKYLSKGSGVLVEGKLQTKSWEKDGVKHYKTEILANNVQFTDKKPKDDSQQSGDNVAW